MVGSLKPESDRLGQALGFILNIEIIPNLAGILVYQRVYHYDDQRPFEFGLGASRGIHDFRQPANFVVIGAAVLSWAYFFRQGFLIALDRRPPKNFGGLGY